MNQLRTRVEGHCPRCNASFVVSPSAQTRKIQCPNCRHVVALGAPSEARPADDSIAERLAGLEARVTRQEAIIEQLLTQGALTPAVEAVPPPPVGDSLLCTGQTLRWLQRDPQSWVADGSDPEQNKVLLHNLRAMGQREIVVQTGPNDEIGHRVVARLSVVLREAGWKVSTPESMEDRRAVRGLVIAAGQCPMPRAATAAYMALQAAGLPITSRLDSTLGPEQWLLIAGCAPASAA